MDIHKTRHTWKHFPKCSKSVWIFTKAVWETTARQLAKGEWKFQVASKIHIILAGLASKNMKTLATITGYSFKIS
jgi:hypothetical protein